MTGFRIELLSSSRGRHTRFDCDWSSDVCSSDLSLGCEQRGRIEFVGEALGISSGEDLHPGIARLPQRSDDLAAQRAGAFALQLDLDQLAVVDRKSVV